MTDRSTLEALRGRIRAAQGPDQILDGMIEAEFSEWRNLGGHWEAHKVTGERRRTMYPPSPPVTASIDAALALVDLVLPGTSWEVRRSGFGTPSQAHFWDPMKQPPGSTLTRVDAATPPLAVLLALLSAKLAEAGETEG